MGIDALIKSILSTYHGRYHTIGFSDLRAVSINMIPVYSGVCRSTDSEAMNIVEVIDEVREICGDSMHIYTGNGHTTTRISAGRLYHEPKKRLGARRIRKLRKNITLLNRIGKLLREEPALGRVMAMRKHIYVDGVNVRKLVEDLGYDKQILKDVKRIRGKHRLLYEVAQVSIERPEGTIKDVIYPVAPEQTLRDLVQEFKAGGSYEQKVQDLMRGSYSHHYRRMVPLILKTLTFSSTSTAPKPLLAALELIRKYADKNQSHYPETEDVPLDGIVPASWLPLVKQGQRVNRISYELCVLKMSREKLRCKEIYVIGANRYRNPDEDLSVDFPTKRNEYYAELDLTLSADEFIATQKRQMQEALDMFDRGLPKNKNVEITKRNDKPWIKLSKLKPQPEPKNLVVLKAEIGRRWGQLFLLDVFKEAALRIGFPNFFKSPALYETLPRETLQIRLLLCLFALGTNIGLKRIVSGITEKYWDILYVRNRFINKDNLRAAIALVANAILRERKVQIWGEATSCAGDSKKFVAYDQNLLTEWHIRYRGPGIMVYWHVEKKAICIYSQIKRCSSSEVASMIQGLLRHCTDMTNRGVKG